jgi:hypothetical protein
VIHILVDRKNQFTFSLSKGCTLRVYLKKMKTPSLVKDYTKLSDVNLDFRAQAIIVSLTGNGYFTVTVPPLASLIATKTAYSTSLNNAVSGDKTAIALKNQAKEELLMMIKMLALNLESQAAGNRAMLVSTGFELASEGENVPPIHAPTNFVMLEGINKGEIKFSVKGVPRAISYIHQYTPDPLTESSIWISKASSLREHTFTGLTSGVRIHGRVAAIGRKNQEAYTEVLSKVVQ